MKLANIVLALLLVGCSTPPLRHTPAAGMTTTEAQSFIRLVLTEQPQKFVPQEVVFSEDFFLVGGGLSARWSGATEQAFLVGASNKRIYYSSVGATKIYKRRHWYVIDICDTDGYRIMRVYSRNEAKARKFADAVAVLAADWRKANS